MEVSRLADRPETAGVYRTRVSLVEEGANTEAYNVLCTEVNILLSASVCLVLLFVVLVVLEEILADSRGLGSCAKVREDEDSTVPSFKRQAYNLVSSSKLGI